MWIEDFDNLDSSETWVWASPEKSSESSEKARDKAKKAISWIKRIQKDEKKAKKYDMVLAWFLVKIIIDKKYDFLLTELFKVMDYWYPSNFVLWILSLINIEISDRIRLFSGKEAIKFSYKSLENIEFNDNNLPKEIKDRINFWIEDIIDSTTIDYSEIQIKRINYLLIDDKQIIFDFINKILVFFLKNSNINIKQNEAFWISDFIVKEVSSSINKALLKLEDN